MKLLLLHGANLANGYSQEIASLIALNNNPTLPQEKLLSIIQNDDISWVSTDFSLISVAKTTMNKNILRELATWGVILGNQAFVTNMISLRQDTLPLAERTEYLRLALHANRFDIANTLLEFVHGEDSSNPSKTAVCNYMLHLMVIECAPRSVINFYYNMVPSLSHTRQNPAKKINANLKRTHSFRKNDWMRT